MKDYFAARELMPLLPMLVVIAVAQVLGAYFLTNYQWPVMFERAWKGGAIATFPGFLLGLLTQYRFKRESLHSQGVTVLLLGLVSLALTLIAVWLVGRDAL